MSVKKPIAVIRGTIAHDLFYIALTVNGTEIPRIIVDTGASTLIFNGEVARQLNLPNLRPIAVSGVGGTASAFQSKCRVKLGGRVFRDVPCVVIQRFSKRGLLGLKFFRDNRLNLLVDPAKQELKIFESGM